MSCAEPSWAGWRQLVLPGAAAGAEPQMPVASHAAVPAEHSKLASLPPAQRWPGPSNPLESTLLAPPICSVTPPPHAGWLGAGCRRRSCASTFQRAGRR